MSNSTPDTSPVPLWYRLPDGFTEVDLQAEPQERLAAARAAMTQLYEGVPTESVDAALESFEFMLGGLVEDGLVHFSSFLLRSDSPPPAGSEDAGLISGTCQMFVGDRPPGDPHLFATDMLEQYPEESPQLNKGLVELECGTAAVVAWLRAVDSPAEYFGVEEGPVQPVYSVSFHVAVPRSTRAVSVVLSTEDLDYQEEFLEIATAVAMGVRVTPPPAPVAGTLEPAQAEAVHRAIADDFG